MFEVSHTLVIGIVLREVLADALRGSYTCNNLLNRNVVGFGLLWVFSSLEVFPLLLGKSFFLRIWIIKSR